MNSDRAVVAASSALTFGALAYLATRHQEKAEKLIAATFDSVAGPLLDLGCLVTDTYVSLRFQGEGR